MGEITGGELILKHLAQEKVSHIFGVPDFAYNPILGKLDKYGIRFVTPRHEAAAGHMADAFYRASGQIAATLSGAGPGTANMVSAFVTAYAEGIPCVGITAQRRCGVCYPDRGGAFQYTNQMDLFAPVTKWNAYVRDVERIPEYMQKAFREALSGRPGPVHIDVPDDVIYATVEEDDYRVAPPERYRLTTRLPADPKLIADAAKLLAEAKLPLLHFGGGIRHSWAHEEALALADFLGAPISISPAVKGFIPSDHPLSFNILSDANLEVRKTADVVLVVGSQMGDLEFFCQPPDWGEFGTQKFIQVDVDPSVLGRSRDVDIAILGDAKRVLSGLLSELKDITKKREMRPEVERLKEIDRRWWQETLSLAESAPSSPVHPGKLAMEVRDFFPRDALMAMDGGNTALYSMIYHDSYEPGTLFWTSKFGHLGTGIPYIMGAKLARPDRLAYVITGDSACGFNLMELESARRQNIPIIVIINADYQWGMEAPGQIMDFGGRDAMVGVTHYPIRYDRIAQAMDCHGEYVEDATEIKPALKRAVDSGLPAVIHVVGDVEASTWAPHLMLFFRVFTGEGPMEEGAEAT